MGYSSELPQERMAQATRIKCGFVNDRKNEIKKETSLLYDHIFYAALGQKW